MIITATRDMQRWSAEVSEESVTFRCAPHLEDHTAASALPRVWPGRGLGISEIDLRGLTTAIAEVMKTNAYWRARHRAGTQDGRGERTVWSVPRRDDEDGFVYLTGPCGHPTGEVGYRPAVAFDLLLPEIRGLRIRLTAYLHPPTGRHSLTVAPASGSSRYRLPSNAWVAPDVTFSRTLTRYYPQFSHSVTESILRQGRIGRMAVHKPDRSPSRSKYTVKDSPSVHYLAHRQFSKKCRKTDSQMFTHVLVMGGSFSPR